MMAQVANETRFRPVRRRSCALIAYMCSPCLHENRPGRSRMDLVAKSLLLIFGLATLLIPAQANGAEYQGQKVDGVRYWGFARSLDTGKYCPARVIFEQNHASVRLTSGRSGLVPIFETSS